MLSTLANLWKISFLPATFAISLANLVFTSQLLTYCASFPLLILRFLPGFLEKRLFAALKLNYG
jgi:hypothetical protein